MDPLTLAAGVATVAGVGAGWRWRQRARQAEAEAGRLRRELLAERHAASHDPLTGLPNRRAFYQLGAELVADPRRRHLVAAVLDLDDFKQINDRYGHAAGDEVLVSIARRFASYAGDGLVARLGGDEFAGLLVSAAIDERWLHQTGETLAVILAAPIRVAGDLVVVTASVGLVPVDGCTDLGDVLRHADAAMYRAKTRRDRVAALRDDLVCHPDTRPTVRTRDLVPDDIAQVATWFDGYPRSHRGTARAS
jgi:diguanylate cyclase (GGDEF)-like protein